MARVNWAEWNAWLDENYQAMTTREISEHIGCSMQAVRQQAFKQKLTKFPDDISFFENWTPESAYIVGLWAADGYANVRPGKGVALCISQSHGGGILGRIQDLVGRGNLYHIQQHNSRRWEIHSRKLYEFLNALFGHDVQAKSKTMQWPDIASGFERDFIRGFCDGDAHLGIDGRGYATVRFSCGSIDFRDAIARKIAGLTGIQASLATDKLGVNLAIYAGIKAVCLAKWLYQDGDLSIPRKIEVAQELASQEQDRINKNSLTPKMRQMFPDTLDRYWRETAQFLLSGRKPEHAGWSQSQSSEMVQASFI